MFPNLSPYSLAIKVGLSVAAVAAFAILTLGYLHRGDQIASLHEWRDGVILATTDATVEPGRDGKRKLLTAEQIVPAIAALKRTSDSCLAASAERTRITQDAKARADEADRLLANVQTIMRGEYSSAQKRIEALERVKAAPTPELACQAIGTDSKAAWEAWK